jgi:branched-subunit amino acid transport protein
MQNLLRQTKQLTTHSRKKTKNAAVPDVVRQLFQNVGIKVITAVDLKSYFPEETNFQLSQKYPIITIVPKIQCRSFPEQL